jgi:polygalacturonase
LDTAAISKTIQAANAAGGGRVVFPPGVYLSGTFELLSNVTLDVQANAMILGSPNVADYGAISTEYFSQAIECEDFRDFSIDGLESRAANGTAATVSLRRGRGVSILNSRALPGTGTFLQTAEVTGEGLFALNDLRKAKRAFSKDPGGFSLTGNLMPPKP